MIDGTALLDRIEANVDEVRARQAMYRMQQNDIELWITPPDGSGQLAEAYSAMGEILFQKKEWGPGCQNFAYALARLKAKQEPREKLNDLLTDVEKRLKSANQKEIAKQWVEEAKPLIQ